MTVSVNHNGRRTGASSGDQPSSRKLLVVLLGALAGTAIIVAAWATFGEGSWWHANLADRPLDGARRARLAAIRDEIDATGLFPDAVSHIDAALDPHIAPTTVRDYLIEAREVLESAADVNLGSVRQDIESLIGEIRPRRFDATRAPGPLRTLVPRG